MTLVARPTTYEGIRMRSRLEADTARFLSEEGLTWNYEPRAFADRIGTYLPDFEILDQPRPTFVEVKGTFALAEPAMERMEIIWSSIPDAQLVIIFGNHSHCLITHGRRWENVPIGEWRSAA